MTIDSLYSIFQVSFCKRTIDLGFFIIFFKSSFFIASIIFYTVKLKGTNTKVNQIQFPTLFYL